MRGWNLSDLDDTQDGADDTQSGDNNNENVITTVDIAEVEAIASKQGWRENGELGALEFLSKGRVFRDNLVDEIHELKAENSKVYKIVADHIHSTKQDKYEETTVSLESQIREAGDAGDTEKVISLSKQLSQSTPPVEPEYPQNAYVNKWSNDNPWFNEEPEMRKDAQGFYQAEIYGANGVDNPEVILPIVKARIKKLYPNHFDPVNHNRERSAAGEGGNNRQKANAGGLKFSDLDKDEQKHFQQFKDMGISEEKLLQSYADGRTNRGV